MSPPFNIGVPARLTVNKDPKPALGSRDTTTVLKTVIWIAIASILAYIVGHWSPHELQTPILLLIGERIVLLFYELNPTGRRDLLMLRLVYWACCLTYIIPNYYTTF